MRPSAKSPALKNPTPLLLCIFALALCPHCAQADDWYQPVQADFKPLYDHDTADRKYQSWDGRDSYWYWVQTFYNGYKKRVMGMTVARQDGWTETSRRLVDRVTSASARHALTLSLNTLGRDISGGWAKNDHACRIHTRDLRRWRDRLSEAGEHETGNGQVLAAAVRAIQTEVDTHLKGRP